MGGGGTEIATPAAVGQTSVLQLAATHATAGGTGLPCYTSEWLVDSGSSLAGERAKMKIKISRQQDSMFASLWSKRKIFAS